MNAPGHSIGLAVTLAILAAIAPHQEPQPKAACFIFSPQSCELRQQRAQLLHGQSQRPHQWEFLAAVVGSDPETRIPIGVAALPILAIERHRTWRRTSASPYSLLPSFSA
jgi:hypothetical protein